MCNFSREQAPQIRAAWALAFITIVSRAMQAHIGYKTCHTPEPESDVHIV